MSELIGLIPAAGRGVRAYPYAATIPKSMLEVDGVPILQRNVELMRDQLGIRDIRIVVGHNGDVIRDYFGDGGRLGVAIRYVLNDRIELELPYSVFLAGRDIHDCCCMILGDEYYGQSNHRELLQQPYRSATATCGIAACDNPKRIRKNYVASFRDGVIVGLQEKPTTIVGSHMGTGTYLLHPEIFRRLREAYGPGPTGGPKDWTSWLGSLCDEGVRILPFFLTGDYVNVNSRDDLNYANYLARDSGFDRRFKSLVYVVDEETDAAAGPILKFAEQPLIDEVVVVAPRRFAALENRSEHPKVRVVISDDADIETGDLVKLGVDSSRGSILILSYCDDTFVPSDVSKLLVYLRDADMVVGTRTTRQMIEQGTNMRGMVRVAHVGLAKLVEFLWWRFESRFTDICCVYRAFWRSTYDTVRGNLISSGVELFPELVLEALRARKRIIEIPVNYYNRDVGSPYVRSKYQSMETFGKILWLIIRKRWADLWPWNGRRRRGRPARLTQA